MFDVTRDAIEAAFAAAIADGLDSGRPPPAGLLDVALACGMPELRPRRMTVRDWLKQVDLDGSIARLTAGEREELVTASAAWPGRYLDVEVWSEGTAVIQEMLERASPETSSARQSGAGWKSGGTTGRG